MEMDKISAVVFSVGSLFITPFWLLMALAPRWRWTERIVRSPAIVAGPLVLYAGLVLPLLSTLLPAVARPSLPVIAGLLGSPRGATIAWMHFLALDLFVGRWIFLDGQVQGRSAWLISPLLALTLLFAPLGLGVYLLVRGGRSDLPVTRWSTEGGDLRAPHFFGLHALQALPLAAWLLERRRRGGRDEASARPIIGLGIGWIGLTVVALAQALRGEPLLSPDRLTLVAAALVLVVAAATMLGDRAKLALGTRAPAFRS